MQTILQYILNNWNMYCSLPASAVESSSINLYENFTEFLSQIFE